MIKKNSVMLWMFQYICNYAKVSTQRGNVAVDKLETFFIILVSLEVKVLVQ